MSETLSRVTEAELEYIYSPKAIRERAAAVVELAKSGKTHFEVNESNLPAVVEFVTETIFENYPDLKIPFHSRWSHFRVGNIDRMLQFDEKARGKSAEEILTAKLDLVIASVLLDAGAGDTWRFVENGREYSRSEGLAVASFHMFMAGDFSSRSDDALRVDAEKLEKLDAETLARGFQVSGTNPLAGFEGRLELLRALGKALRSESEVFGKVEPRPGHIWRYLQSQSSGNVVRAKSILRAVQKGLGSIWPGRVSLNGENLGDVWAYPSLGSGFQSLVAFHKLSQWLSYSLIEPMEEKVLKVEGVEELTGLAEYRNGGLLIDLGLITPRNMQLLKESHAPSSEFVVEWRALTVHYLDRIAEGVRRQLGKTEAEFPLARVLEGGTWWAGRRIAKQLRPGGGPPVKIVSDGTVF